MAARAMWKGVIRLGDARVPVKLYAGVEDRSIHFRLLHRPDQVPVRQAMINPETEEEIPYERSQRAYVTEEKDLVILHQEDLNALQPEPSRDIELLRFVPPETIDHRWYDRPYYLGPDGDAETWSALAHALEQDGREGVARWTMRKKEYLGVLRLHRGYPLLMSLRPAEQVIAAEELEAPHGRALDPKELDMARQLMEMLEAPFDPSGYRNEHRERVLELIEAKARGKRIKTRRPRQRRPSDDLTGALEASLQSARRERESA